MEPVKSTKDIIAEKIAQEVELLKQSDPDENLNKEMEIASLVDLQKILDE